MHCGRMGQGRRIACRSSAAHIGSGQPGVLRQVQVERPHGGGWRPLVEAVLCVPVRRGGQREQRGGESKANRHRCSLLQLVLVAHPQLSRAPEPLRPGSPAWRYCSVSWPAGHRSKVSSSGPSVHRRSGCTAPRSRPEQLSPSFSGTGCLCGVHLAFAVFRVEEFVRHCNAFLSEC